MLPLFDRKHNESEHPDSGPTRFICWLLASDRTRADAGKRARELGVDLAAAEYWWRNVRRK